MECCILSALKCWSVPYVANGEGLPEFYVGRKIQKIHRLDQGCQTRFPEGRSPVEFSSNT